MSIYKIIAPLTIPISKHKKMSLNLNIYRNANRFALDTAKRNYKKYLKEEIQKLPVMKFGVEIAYVYYARRKSDLMNICSIHSKFFEDALSELGKIPDDNINYLKRIILKFGGYDTDNPRVEILIRYIGE